MSRIKRDDPGARKESRLGNKSFDKVKAHFYRVAPLLDGVVAQLVEHHNGIVGVRGSNPLGSTIQKGPQAWRKIQ